MKRYTAGSLGIDIDAVEQQLSEHRSLPIHTYHDPAVFEFELNTIFHRSWQYFDLVERVSDPGDVVVGMVGRVPIAVTRDYEGNLHGFVNICRHRGFRVAQENRKKCRRLTCRYHGWSYGMNGKLASAPDTDDEPGFEKEDFSLLRVSVDTWGPAVFVNPDPGAAPLIESFPRLAEWTERFQFIMDPGHYTLAREIVKEQQSNWKLWYDNGTECYHCPIVHGESFGEAFAVREGEYEFFLDGSMTSYAFKPSANLGVSDSKHLRSQTYRSLQFFPGCQVIQQDDIMILSKMTPTGPGSCVFTSHYLAEQGADPARVDQWIDIWDQTFNEDAEVAEVQQVNIASERAPLFRYVSNREAPSQYINSLIWEAYKQGFSNPTDLPFAAE